MRKSLLYYLNSLLEQSANYSRLNGKGFFRDGLIMLRSRLDQRYYVSPEPFYKDLEDVFTAQIFVSSTDLESPSQGSGSKNGLTPEQKEKLKVAKRIIRAIQPVFDDASMKEADLLNKPYHKSLSRLDMFETKLVSLRAVGHLEDLGDDEPSALAICDGNANGLLDGKHEDVDMESPSQVNGESAADSMSLAVKQASPTSHPTPATSTNSNVNSVSDAIPNDDAIPKSEPPPTPPLSSSSKPSANEALAHGGIPHYMEAFEPDGTTIHDEHWTGRDVARSLSDELSDMDEEEVNGLVDGDIDMAMGEAVNGAVKDLAVPEGAPTSVKKKNGKLKKRWKGFR